MQSGGCLACREALGGGQWAQNSSLCCSAAAGGVVPHAEGRGWAGGQVGGWCGWGGGGGGGGGYVGEELNPQNPALAAPPHPLLPARPLLPSPAPTSPPLPPPPLLRGVCSGPHGSPLARGLQPHWALSGCAA